MILNDFRFIFGYEFLQEKSLNISALDNKDLRDKTIHLFSTLKHLNSSFTLNGTNFNEGVTEYFASKYIKNFQSMSYRKYVEKIKNFIEKLPPNLQKSFERTLMDSKILDPKLGGGYSLLTRWFAANLNLRITPLTFLDLDLDRADIQARLDEIKNQK